MRVMKQNSLRVVINRHAHRHFTVNEVFIGFVLGMYGFASVVRWPPVAMRECLSGHPRAGIYFYGIDYCAWRT